MFPVRHNINEKYREKENTIMTDSRPQGIPPEEEVFATVQDMPIEMPPEEMLAAASLEQAGPIETPPGEEEAAAAVSDAAAAVWHTGKKITALWSKNQNRNSWIAVSSVGWKKLANNSDSAVVALTMLACHARDKGGNVSLKEDSGQIKEMYVW